MSGFRTIEQSFRGASPHWVGDGFWVNQYFPTGRGQEFFQRFSPFLLLDYNAPRYFEPTSVPVGVGAHPHRGFETVTFAFAGKVEHHDNKGNRGVIEPGDVQWMTAGSGILHKEYHEREYAKQGRVFHMVQLWVNLPRKDKMTAPDYQALEKKDMGSYALPEGKGSVSVVAGSAFGVKGPARTFSPMNVYRGTLKEGGVLDCVEPAGFNTGLLLIDGTIEINGDKRFEHGDFVLFSHEEGAIRLKGVSESASFLMLSGEPLNEPVAASGPFVMNTLEEVHQAHRDFQSGMFGDLNF